jgi:hypothetical protein
MKDRLRQAKQAAADLAEKAQHLRPGGSSDDHVDDDDEEVDEELPAVDVSDSDHEALAHLDADDEDCAPIAVETEHHSFYDVLHKLDPTPPVPLTEKHEVGLVPALKRLSDLAPGGLAEDRRVRLVLNLVGDRLAMSAGPDGINIRSLLFRRHTSWKRVQAVRVEGRYDFARSDGFARMLEGVQSPFPIPGLGWLLRRLTKGILQWAERRFLGEDQIAAAREHGGILLLGIKRRGRDIELEGPLLMVSFLSPGLAEAVEAEARLRGIPVDVVEPD